MIWISDKAEFTPKTIQTRDERFANLVYPVKIAVHNDGLLKIGMYADVKILNNGFRSNHTRPHEAMGASKRCAE